MTLRDNQFICTTLATPHGHACMMGKNDRKWIDDFGGTFVVKNKARPSVQNDWRGTLDLSLAKFYEPM